jgi:hypothetical protein
MKKPVPWSGILGCVVEREERRALYEGSFFDEVGEVQVMQTID